MIIHNVNNRKKTNRIGSQAHWNESFVVSHAISSQKKDKTYGKKALFNIIGECISIICSSLLKQLNYLCTDCSLLSHM